jgi:hypothetical protein
MKNVFQDHGVRCCRDPDFPLRALNLFTTNDALIRLPVTAPRAGVIFSKIGLRSVTSPTWRRDISATWNNNRSNINTL